LFDVSEAHTFAFKHAVEPHAVFEDPIQAVLQTLDTLSIRVRDEQEKMAVIEAYLKNIARKPLSEVEHLACIIIKKGSINRGLSWLRANILRSSIGRGIPHTAIWITSVKLSGVPGKYLYNWSVLT